MPRERSGADDAAPAATLAYRSSNGDNWWLLRDPASGRAMVRHEANPSSGGHVTERDVEDFLARGAGPEHQAIRELVAARTGNPAA